MSQWTKSPHFTVNCSVSIFLSYWIILFILNTANLFIVHFLWFCKQTCEDEWMVPLIFVSLHIMIGGLDLRFCWWFLLFRSTKHKKCPVLTADGCFFFSRARWRPLVGKRSRTPQFVLLRQPADSKQVRTEPLRELGHKPTRRSRFYSWTSCFLWARICKHVSCYINSPVWVCSRHTWGENLNLDLLSTRLFS